MVCHSIISSDDEVLGRRAEAGVANSRSLPGL